MAGRYAKASTSKLKAKEGREEGAMFELKSKSVVLENVLTGTKLYIKLVPPKKRD